MTAETLTTRIDAFCAGLSNREVTREEVSQILAAGIGAYLEVWLQELKEQEYRSMHEQIMIADLTSRLDEIDNRALLTKRKGPPRKKPNE